MNADPILKIDHLHEKVIEASLKLKDRAVASCRDPQSPCSWMIDVLAPAGYHQIQQIADVFGVDFDEQLSNEYEWDRFRHEINQLKTIVESELRGRFDLQEGISLCLGYDEKGNFGLIIRSENAKMVEEGIWMN